VYLNKFVREQTDAVLPITPKTGHNRGHRRR
jgi:hypothetical protein